MKLTVLVDNNVMIGKNLCGEPGLSFFIEENNKNILFDLGLNDTFFNNANKLNISLQNLDYLIISHGHDDHIGGLFHLINFYKDNPPEKKPKLILHPGALELKYNKGNIVGNLISEDVIAHYFEIIKTDKPFWISENLVFLGEINRKFPFENFIPNGKRYNGESYEKDYLIDDSALAYKNDSGLNIITGCSHSGICNIIEMAMEICKEKRIADVIGGFHLLNPSQEKVNGTLKYINNLKPAIMHPCHCTKAKYKNLISQNCLIEEIGSGSILEY